MHLSFKHYYWRWMKNLCLVFIFVLFLMNLARVGFAFFFGDHADLLQNQALLSRAMILGLRFDLVPLAYISALPFILLNLGYLLPGKVLIRLLRPVIRLIMFFGLVALTWIYIFDYGFYSYFQDHLNILVYGFLEDDTWALLTSIWKNYNLPLWLALVLGVHFLTWKLLGVAFSPYDFDLKAKSFSWKMPVVFLLGLIGLSLAGRGNFSRLPLSIEDAHIGTNDFLNKLSLNGVITLNRAQKIRKIFGSGKIDYLKQYGFTDWKDAFREAFNEDATSDDLRESLLRKSPVNPAAQKNPPHVVMVVMESFGSYWNDHQSPDFNILGELATHFQNGFLFKNFLPAENGTIGSIVSVATSQVIRPGARFLSESEYMNTPISSSGHLPFKAAGYETHFVYGGKLGWRNLGKFLSLQGYDRLWGAEEIKEAMPELLNIEPRDLGNEWGIFDEYLYTFIEEHLRTSTKPQFFLVLTTSNHPPFEVPSSYNELPLKIEKDFLDKLTVTEHLGRKRFLGVQYGNQKIGEFISKVSSTALAKRTIIALTGDHSYWIAKGVSSEQEFKRYAVPFFIHAPEAYRPAFYDPNNFGSHEDIFPTLYHLSLSGARYIKLGDDLFAEAGTAQNSSGLFASPAGAIHHEDFWKWKSDQILEVAKPDPELSGLKRRRDALITITDLFLKEEKTRTPSASESGPRSQSSP